LNPPFLLKRLYRFEKYSIMYMCVRGYRYLRFFDRILKQFRQCDNFCFIWTSRLIFQVQQCRADLHLEYVNYSNPMSNHISQCNVLHPVDSTVLAIYQSEQHEHAKRAIRSYTLKKDRKYNCQKKKNKTKRQTMIYKTLHRKLKIEQQETY
jgi:hypothetical protein